MNANTTTEPQPPTAPEEATQHTADNSQDLQDCMTPEEAQAALTKVSSMFYSGNPKHAMNGAGEGLSNVAAGVPMGLAALVGSTAVGSREGVLGGVKGVGAGLVGLVGLTGYGAYTGIRQAAKGLRNTPEAVTQVTRGEMLWDSNKEQWVKVVLAEEFQNLPITDDDITAKARELYNDEVKKEEAEKAKREEPAEQSPHAPTSTTTPATQPTAESPYPGMNEKGEVTDYYLFMGVDKAATAEELKKAFTRKALQMHPDKNPNDPNATARFQQLMQVYNVLSNEATRAEYDRTGSVNASSVEATEVNPVVEVLGVEFLKPLVGKLRFAAHFDANVLYDSDMQKELHRRRRLRIARNLCEYLDNEEKGFDSASVVLRDAVATRAGPQIVTFVAETYHTASRQHLYGSSWKRELDSWYTSKATSLSTSLGLMTSGVRATYKAARQEATEDDILALLVAANESDVRRTVLQACRLVLYDSSVNVEARNRRAEQLDRLGNIAMEEVRKELASRQTLASAEAARASQPGEEHSA